MEKMYGERLLFFNDSEIVAIKYNTVHVSVK